MIGLWIGVAVVAVLAGAWFYRRTRRRPSRLISIVGLLSEPVTFDAAVLASVAGRVWNADLGDGSSEGPDGFVACVDPISTINERGRMYLINSFSTPYVEDPGAVAESIRDLRIRGLFGEHKAWFSCDALGPEGTESAEEITDWYRRLGKLFVELLDERCLLVLIPELEQAYPINEDTDRALRSDDPLKSLKETLTVPILEVPEDDPLMQQAVKKARESWPGFVAAFEAGAGESFSVKAPVTSAGNTEFIWISVTAIEGDLVYGTLGNDPANLGPLKLGSKVSVPVTDLNDWCYIDPEHNMAGGFTIAAVQEASKRLPKK